MPFVSFFCPNENIFLILYFLTIFLSFDGENYHSMESSKFSHAHTYGLANYKGKALAVGCDYSFRECSYATELFDMTSSEWSDGPKFPFGYG